MGKKLHYRVSEKDKKVFADIIKLTEKEMVLMERYARLGYEIINEEEKRENKTKEQIEKEKQEKEKAKANNPISMQNVEKFLESIKETEKEIYNEYYNKKNEIVCDKETGKQIKNKDGSYRKKGFISGYSVFKKFYEYDENKKEFKKINK